MKHQRILNWVNRIRRKHFGKGPLKRLPKGRRKDCGACPIHNSFWRPWTVGCVTDNLWGEDGKIIIVLPIDVRQFMDDFDNGKYPELER